MLSNGEIRNLYCHVVKSSFELRSWDKELGPKKNTGRGISVGKLTGKRPLDKPIIRWRGM